MLCCFPVHNGDIAALHNLLVWIRQLLGCREHHATIVADAATNRDQLAKIKEEASKSFSDVAVIFNKAPVSGWIPGANSLFLEAARHAESRGAPWLFLEPDAVPLKLKWLDTIDIHYRATGARYMGQLVKCEKAGLPPLHMPGVSVYPASAYSELSPTVLSNKDKAFDMALGDITAASATKSKLFQHLWGEFGDPPRFGDKRVSGTSAFDLNYISPNAVLFHRNKDGSLIRLLRDKYGILGSRKDYPFIQLGRYGDIILLLPALKLIHDVTGNKPKVICSNDYAAVLDGVSYVDPIVLHVNWYDGMPHARKYAQQHFGGGVVIQCFGGLWSVERRSSETFMQSMIQRTGVPFSMFHDLPLVFDRRSKEREDKLVKDFGPAPHLLVNCAGNSSPFHFKAQLFSALQQLKSRVKIIDMANIRCHRIYDLLGLMDSAVGMITIDTATLHLAQASQKPYVALTVDGWCSSIPRGRCSINIKYSQCVKMLPHIVKVVSKWL